MAKKLRYMLEAIVIYMFYGLFKLMPLDWASGFGSVIGTTIGPHLRSTNTAYKNLELVFPDMDIKEKHRIVRSMWDNLGRTFAEYPHLKKIGRDRTTIKNPEILKDIDDNNQPAVMFTGHLSNWEIGPVSVLMQQDIPVHSIYRAPNNPWADELLNKARSVKNRIAPIPKSKSGTRSLVKALKEKQKIGILIDQKYNEGIAALFLGQPAMTSPVFIELCHKFKCPLVPGRMEREKGANFTVTFFEPITIFDDKEKPLPVEDVLTTAHSYLEEWIKEKPEQWLWIHKRWSETAVKAYRETSKT